MEERTRRGAFGGATPAAKAPRVREWRAEVVSDRDMFKPSFLSYPPLCSVLRAERSFCRVVRVRTLFSLSDLAKFAPFTSEDSNGKPDDPHTYHERKIFPSVSYKKRVILRQSLMHFQIQA